MKKGQKKTKKPQQIIEELSDASAKAYAQKNWENLKQHYKQHKTTAYYAYKHGMQDAVNNPELLKNVSDEVLAKAGLTRIEEPKKQIGLQCVVCAGTGKALMLDGQSTSGHRLQPCTNCNGTGVIMPL